MSVISVNRKLTVIITTFERFDMDKLQALNELSSKRYKSEIELIRGICKFSRIQPT